MPIENAEPTFAELGVIEPITRALAEENKQQTFAIQEQTLPIALSGADIIGQARTGTGKTLGFGVPLLQRIAALPKPAPKTVHGLVLVPTRELCQQVFEDVKKAAKYVTRDGSGLKISAIYGGKSYDAQADNISQGLDIIVGTPGRILDLQGHNHLDLSQVAILVLDEADEMLDLGFLPDIEKIFTVLPSKRQTMLFSATLPGPIITLSRKFLTSPTHVRAEQADQSHVHDTVTQIVYRAHSLDKDELVSKILQSRDSGTTMIFTRTKRAAAKLSDELSSRGFSVGAVHGDLHQIAREKALQRFREDTIKILVATDVAARGIDIEDITHVINYHCPDDENTYIHRIGRTGRAGRSGIAITLVDWEDLPRWENIDKALNLNLGEPVETYSSSPHLFTDLNIPAESTGRIGKPTRKPRSTNNSHRGTQRTNRVRTRTRSQSLTNLDRSKEQPAGEAQAKPTTRVRKRTRKGV